MRQAAALATMLAACTPSAPLAPVQTPEPSIPTIESAPVEPRRDDPGPRRGFVDPSPPEGWLQCAGFVNTIADDIAPGDLDACLGGTRLRVRVFTADNALEDDVAIEDIAGFTTWPSRNYVHGRVVVDRRTHWGGLDGGAPSFFFTSNDGMDACGQRVAETGTTLGSGHAEKAIIAVDAAGYDEYRVSCGKQALPDRKVALYR